MTSSLIEKLKNSTVKWGKNRLSRDLVLRNDEPDPFKFAKMCMPYLDLRLTNGRSRAPMVIDDVTVEVEVEGQEIVKFALNARAHFDLRRKRRLDGSTVFYVSLLASLNEKSKIETELCGGVSEIEHGSEEIPSQVPEKIDSMKNTDCYRVLAMVAVGLNEGARSHDDTVKSLNRKVAKLLRDFIQNDGANKIAVVESAPLALAL